MDLPELTPEESREIADHQNALLNIRALTALPSGKAFIKYLFKSLGATELPERGLQGVELFEALVFHRAGNTVFKLVSQADPEVAAELLALIEGEKYVDAREPTPNTPSSEPST